MHSEERDLVLLARTYARITYGDMVYEGIHLFDYATECAKEIADGGGTRDEIIAAYLRDALKHNLSTPEDLRELFGDRAVLLAQK